MLTQSLSLPAIHYVVRRAWRRYVLPVHNRRDDVAALAALVVASTSLDEVLLAEGRRGESAGERLYQARTSFSDYERLCDARRIRHLAVHHLDSHLCWPAVATALDSFGQALREHGVGIESR
jgi:hypothetical protein